MRRVATLIVAASLASWACLGGPPSVLGGVINLGPEEIVQAGGVDLAVLGYSVPCYVDWDNDGRSDLVVGEGGGGYSGKVRVYLNGGTVAAPAFSGFQYVQAAGADLEVLATGCLGAFPRVGHFNDDGKKDLLVGQADGKVKLFLNVGTDTQPTFDIGTLLQAGPAGAKTTIDVGDRATVALTDWDNDYVTDLVLGALDGRTRLYRNQGSNQSPDFASGIAIGDLLGGDLLVPSARSSPVVMDLDGDAKKDLLAGNTNGEILLYSNQGTDAAPSFSSDFCQYVTSDGVKIDLAGTPRSRPTVADWTGDGRLDLLVGAGDGKIHLYQGVPEPGSLVLLAAGGLAVLLVWRGRRRIGGTRRRPPNGWVG